MNYYKAIDEAKDRYRTGQTKTIELSKKAFNSIHKDFRSTKDSKSHPSCLCMTNQGTCLVPVTFVKEDHA